MKSRIFKTFVSLLILSLVALILPKDNNSYRYKRKIVILKEPVSGLLYISEVEKVNKNVDKVLEEVNRKMNEINSVKDLMEWFVSYKNIINEYSSILEPPETIYDYYTIEELDMLFRVVQAEVGDEHSFVQKVNVVSIIFNRIEHEYFGNEMLQILTKDQFQPISDGRYLKVKISKETILACEYCFMFGDTTNGCLFFDSNGKLNYEFVYSDGAHNFYR